MALNCILRCVLSFYDNCMVEVKLKDGRSIISHIKRKMSLFTFKSEPLLMGLIIQITIAIVALQSTTVHGAIFFI